MVDDEVREALESLNRKRAWLMRAIDTFPDLAVYRRDDDPRYCSASVNGSADAFDVFPLIDRSPYHDHPPEQNVAVCCYVSFEGQDLYAWPPKFIIGEIDDGERLLFDNWQRQLRDAGIAGALIAKIEKELSALDVKRAGNDWVNGDPDYGVWTAQDDEGDVVGVLRLHGRLNSEATSAIRARAEALGFHFVAHDGGFTADSAQDLQAFVDDTLDFYVERAADRQLTDAKARNAA